MIHRRTLGAAALTGAIAPAALSTPALAEGGPESTFEQVRTSKKLRVGVVAGQAPYSTKDPATGQWRGFIPDLGRDLAHELDVEFIPVESGWGNAVLDLQSNKVDIFFGQNPTPRRALAVDFTHPLFSNAFTLIAKRDLAEDMWGHPTWAQLNNPAVRLSVEIGSSYDQIVAEICPKATVSRMKTAREATLEVQSGRADAQVIVALLSLSILKANPGLGKLLVPTPILGTTTSAAVRRERDKTWRDFVDIWIDWNKGLGRIRTMVLNGLATSGVTEADIPPQIVF